jgi:KDO2-lipid IV(A) lauroyltransferase
MLVDQYYVRGVPVTFFGRKTRANPLIARLARNIECPIHGIRVVRHPGNRFQLHLTEAIEPPRDAEGKIDIERTMQAITDVVEGWIREHPEQWLWVHRRWRDENA